MRRQQATAALFMTMIMAHGMGDYPMRTGTIACIFGFLAAFLTVPEEAGASRSRSRSDLGEDAFGVYGQNQDVVPVRAIDRGLAAQGGEHYS
jgi:hypothetical protein